jgi:hypothetical protein
MSRNTLLVDVAIAAILTILIVVLSPGLAVVGLIALVIVLVCAVSFARDARRRRRKPARRRPPSLRELRDLAEQPPRRDSTRQRSAPAEADRRRRQARQPQPRRRPPR